jgi:putative DNA primase/helicase
MTSKGSQRGNQNWESRLIRNSSGKPKAIFANALLALREAPHLRNRLRFNEMSLCTEVCAPLPWDKPSNTGEARAWTDNDDRLLTEWLQRNDINIKSAEATAAAETVGREFPFHPVKSYLDGLQWDGVIPGIVTGETARDYGRHHNDQAEGSKPDLFPVPLAAR